MRILVTGGAGYIGSHICAVLLEAGFDVSVIENFANSSRHALQTIEKLFGQSIDLHVGDVCSRQDLRAVFEARPDIHAVMHLAGLKAVGESVKQPLRFFHENLCGTLALLQQMEDAEIKRLIFSSSGSIYTTAADMEASPLDETQDISGTNPYSRSKRITEEFFHDLVTADPEWRICSLRYFNPIGAHPSGLFGENDPDCLNLLPKLARVLTGRDAYLSVFGTDFPTPDGTCIRDYIHVMDLAEGHLRALRYLLSENCPEVNSVFNLGTGTGYSVLEVIRAFEAVCLQPIPVVFTHRRPGDLAATYASVKKAYRELNWQASRTLEEMCRDEWRWRQTQLLAEKSIGQKDSEPAC